MAACLKEEKQVRRIYDALQAASCPWVGGLGLQEAETLLRLLTSPSEHRTNILMWICCRINQNFWSSKKTSVTAEERGVLTREMAHLGRELMLCRADDVDLIEGRASVGRQISFLEQLLTIVSSQTSSRPRVDAETMLDVFYATESLPHLSQMLEPVFQPWTGHMKTLEKDTKASSKQSREVADVCALLETTQSALEELQSECEFWNKDVPSPSVFSPSSLRVAACDLQQLIATFSHVFESDLRVYCSSEHRSFSAETDVFKRVHQLLQACLTEVEMLKEASEASLSLKEDLEQLQSRGHKHTLQDRLEEVAERVSDFLSLLPS
ncbi:HAUS augmin-like complex subunit 7 isoform X2 [Antennarius striatus]|uniref:HAUS augmin-like complex subunit 7 isoform X2 n=1 Tax=Antennarius striatus TaxID=241820 RepID=UPI0035B32B1C